MPYPRPVSQALASRIFNQSSCG